MNKFSEKMLLILEMEANVFAKMDITMNNHLQNAKNVILVVKHVSMIKKQRVYLVNLKLPVIELTRFNYK